MRVLVVEDDPRMRNLVRLGLSEGGHVVDVADSGPPALGMSARAGYDVMVLDVMLPGASGLDVVRALRRDGNHTPVLMLTARDAAADIVARLDAGADDDLVKPFAFKVLLARLRALGRRSAAHDDVLQHADVRLDRSTRTVARAGSALALTRTEYNLLECLMRKAGRVVTRERLMDELWGPDPDVSANTLEAFVKSLRHKLDAEGRPRLVHTIRGVGYCLREEPEA